jgi:hypothetical protein
MTARATGHDTPVPDTAMPLWFVITPQSCGGDAASDPLALAKSMVRTAMRYAKPGTTAERRHRPLRTRTDPAVGRSLP